jgi:hypothetical protein
LEDNPRSGRPITTITQQNIDAVKDPVKDDPRISVDYITNILDIVYYMNYRDKYSKRLFKNLHEKKHHKKMP